MHSNGLLKWLMIPMILVVVFIGSKLFSNNEKQPTPNTSTQLTPEEAKHLGVNIEGDTPSDTVATLVAQVRQLRTELETAISENKKQLEENNRLRQRDVAIDQRIQNALANERTQLHQDREQITNERQQTQGLLQELQARLDGMNKHQDLPIGLGLESSPALSNNALFWIEPDDARKTENGNASKNNDRKGPTHFGEASKTFDDTFNPLVDSTRNTIKALSIKPVYTLPINSTLTGSIAMTALIGRIPVDGTVNDPFPFKVIIGNDNLIANGIEIPDVAGAIMSGTASGDWTLSCVRGQIRSMTFVFNDGTIRTVPSEDNDQQQQNNSAQNGIGWISDPYGIPCVSGERRSNAQQYLGTQALITAAGAGAASLIDSDTGQVAYASSDGSVGTVGIGGNEAMGRVLASGVQDMSQWINKLYGQAFAAVYVKPGAKVAVHIEEPISIDFDPAGRKVDHQLGGLSHVQEMD